MIVTLVFYTWMIFFISEFTNRKLLQFFKSKNIHPFVSVSSTKNSVNERFNRTIMSRVARYLTHVNSKRFIHKLGDFERQYNNTFHRTIAMTPSQVKLENVPKVWENIYSKKLTKLRAIKTKPLSAGDYVLLPRKKQVFNKGYAQTFGDEVFKIKEVKKTLPTTYKVETLDGNEVEGSFYKQELSKVPNNFRELNNLQ